MRYYIEKFHPHVLAMLTAGLFYYYITHFNDVDKVIGKFMESALTICGALLGFLLTILTLINAIDTRRMRFIKEAGKFQELNHYLRVGLLWNLISISLSFIIPILFSINEIAKSKNYVYTGVVLVITFTWLTNIRFAMIFAKLLTDPEKK